MGGTSEDGLTWKTERASLVEWHLLLQREKSFVFWSKKESDVEQNHQVLDLRVSYSAVGQTGKSISYFTKREKNIFCFGETIQVLLQRYSMAGMGCFKGKK